MADIVFLDHVFDTLNDFQQLETAEANISFLEFGSPSVLDRGHHVYLVIQAQCFFWIMEQGQCSAAGHTPGHWRGLCSDGENDGDVIQEDGLWLVVLNFEYHVFICFHYFSICLVWILDDLAMSHGKHQDAVLEEVRSWREKGVEKKSHPVAVFTPQRLHQASREDLDKERPSVRPSIVPWRPWRFVVTFPMAICCSYN